MLTTSQDHTVRALVERLASDCRDRMTAQVAEDAARVTLAAFGQRSLTTSLERRVRAYYQAVVRRKVLRRSGPRDARARLILASVVDDLTRAGRPASDVLEELERGWSDKIPPHVLEEFRSRLCA